MNWAKQGGLTWILLLCLLIGCQNAAEPVVPSVDQVTEVVIAEEASNAPSATPTKRLPSPTSTHSPTIPPAPTRTPEATRELTKTSVTEVVSTEVVPTEEPTPSVMPTEVKASVTSTSVTSTSESIAETATEVVPTEVPATQVVPTEVPPTEVPTFVPTEVPATDVPTEVPTFVPTEVPATEVPTEVPTFVPTEVAATEVPTEVPTFVPTEVPTFVPTEVPTFVPTEVPPTAIPPTQVPPTVIPATQVPPTAPPPVISSSATGSQPVLLMIPRLGVNAGVESVGQTASGAMDVPKNVQSVGWYNLGVRPGEMGNAVLSGHFDDYKQDPAVFWRLHELSVGDLIMIRDAQGRQHEYQVIGQEIYPFDQAPLSRIFGLTTDTNLNLITCNGTWDENAWNYDKRLVVYTRKIKN